MDESLVIPFLAVELSLPPSVLEEESIYDMMAMIFYMQEKDKKNAKANTKKTLYNPDFT